MALSLISGPSVEPITLAEAKLHCRVDADLTADDALITALIAAARECAEQELNRVLVSQTWERVLDAFPADDDILLGMEPVQSITSVKYIDPTGVEQTVSSSLYVLDKEREGWVILAAGATWPDTMDTVNAVRVRFVAGETSASSVPESIKLWIKLHVGEWYASRELAADKPRAELSYARDLLYRHRNPTRGV